MSNKFLTSEKLGNQLFVISYLRVYLYSVPIKFLTSEKLGNSLIALLYLRVINPCIINYGVSFNKTIVELKSNGKIICAVPFNGDHLISPKSNFIGQHAL